MLKKGLIIIISALLTASGNAPTGWWFAPWFGLAPLWIILSLNNNFFLGENSQFDDNKLIICWQKFKLIFREKLIFSLLWGLTFYGISLFWLTGIHPLTWMGIPWFFSLLITIFCFIFVTIWASGVPLIWSLFLININQVKLFKLISSKFPLLIGVKRVILAVTVWCLLEIIESHTPLWWVALGLTQSPHNLWILQLGKLSGLTTITASVVAVNGLLAESFIYFYYQSLSSSNNNFSLKKEGSLLGLTAIILVTILHLTGLYLFNFPSQINDKESFKIGLIQGNIPVELKSENMGFLQALEGYTKGYQKLAQGGADLILTPETALPFFFQDLPFYSSLYQEVTKEKIPLVVGAFAQNRQGYTNSLFSLDAQGNKLSQYDKIKLVPLGEYIPFSSILGKLIKRLSSFDIFLIQGEQKQVFESFKTSLGKAIVGICYESAFPDLFRFQTLAGGQFMITASNNSFYRDPMLFQHHGQDVLRAIENDRWLARSTNTGLSAIINPQGKTIWISGINTFETHLDTIYKRDTKTLYVKYGDWLIWLLLIMGILL